MRWAIFAVLATGGAWFLFRRSQRVVYTNSLDTKASVQRAASNLSQLLSTVDQYPKHMLTPVEEMQERDRRVKMLSPEQQNEIARLYNLYEIHVHLTGFSQNPMNKAWDALPAG